MVRLLMQLSTNQLLDTVCLTNQLLDTVCLKTGALQGPRWIRSPR